MPLGRDEQGCRLNHGRSPANIVSMIRLLPLCLILGSLIPTQLCAAPEDRGSRGPYLALGTGVALGHATDTEGDSAGSHYGSDFNLRFGEEVIDGLTMGLNISSATLVGNQGLYTARTGGLLVDATWQISKETPFSLLVGTGFGGGSLTAKGENGFAGDVAGAIFIAGAQYNFRWTGKTGGGLSLAPYFRGQLLPASGSSGTRILSWMIGLETAWAWGRGNSD